MMSCWQIVTSLSFFQLMADLEQSERQILGSWSVKVTFSLIVFFHLTKTENRTKKSLTQLSYYCFKKGTILGKKKFGFLQEKCWHQQIKGVVVLEGTFFKTTYVCELVCVPNFKFLA